MLQNLFQKIYIPKKVHEEITYKEDYFIPKFIETVEIDNSEILHYLEFYLDKGESEAIALALERDLPLIIDEKKGRKIAKNLGIKIVGLLGIVYLNVQKGFITKKEAKAFLETAVKNGYRISEKLIEEVLK
ncbi:hypothetical protein NitYY0826_C1765 [Nitratiruptor sp. YY08-26]|nr:hypothetical protein NitYY0813_C1763 [Nitratiruptor sp. YY08-13]BCD66815.1 hypothetical protein NitYY0826_C1765 [Nitratiruptor sp. YY08-26]